MILNVKYQEGIRHLYAKPAFQHTKDARLTIEGFPIVLPAKVSFSNSSDFGNAVIYDVATIPVRIPDEYFVSGDYIQMWLESGDEQLYITIPVLKRPSPVSADGGSGDSAYEYDEEDENLTLYGGEEILKNNMEDR